MQCAEKQVTHEQCILLCLAHYRFTALLQRISNCDETQNTILNLNKVMNIIIWITRRDMFLVLFIELVLRLITVTKFKPRFYFR